MLSRLLGHWRQRRDARALQRRAIPDTLWSLTLQRYPFLARRSEADRDRLRRLTSLFLDRKRFSAAGGLELTDEIAVAIAAQACLPVLALGLERYDGFVGLVVHPDEVLAPREAVDETGVVHRWQEPLTGEAMEGGPVMVTWADARDAGELAAWRYNVVIHEFAHVLDMEDGLADGVPLLPDATARRRWCGVLEPAYDDFCRRVIAGDDTLLDPYGAEGLEEFFAVASEAFFVAPVDLRDQHPALYGLLTGFYRQDPAAA
ncbi:zinc-dependent peptidase [Aquabacterium sp. J223]|uniref:M90 family metallopeptidase n=1 Tax=Aquabacterium sp. J223 TaxID=2898431 RepID=UPI0021ADBE43|nr:M90 family metallopeptidase [Aquabacterium sp. J223]UUX94671.1 zinc-dependent peptidase [Aquabacterium sp. J223]